MPLLFEIGEDTYLKAFLYASLVTGISTGIILEYRSTNPLGLYPADTNDEIASSLRLKDIIHTSIISFISTFFVLWMLYILFGYGKAYVVDQSNY